MPILRDIPVALKAEEIVASKVKTINPTLLQGAKEALARARRLWQPAAVYEWFDVQRIEGECVYLSGQSEAGPVGGNAVLHVGPRADLLASARRVLVSVGTIGPALEQHVGELQAAGEALQAYLLDSAGVVALGAVGEALRCIVEEAAVDRGWGVSPSLSPGSLAGWRVQGQRELCALLPLATIGVRLNAHCVLEPHKSASGLVGLGPDYESTHVGSICKYCALQNTCWRRREVAS